MPDEVLGRLPPICGRAADIDLGGRAADISVEITNLSYRETSGGKRYPYGNFGAEFLDGLHRELPAPSFKGLLRPKPVCRWCGTDLTDVPELPTTVTADVALRPIPPIQVEVVMPGLTCPSCSRRMVGINDADIASDLTNALIAAFESVGLKPG